MSAASADITGTSIPLIPPDSPGSSVSSTLQNEYEELLKYAVVVPKYDPSSIGKTLNDTKGSFPQHVPKHQSTLQQRYQPLEEEEEEDDEHSSDEKSVENQLAQSRTDSRAGKRLLNAGERSQGQLEEENGDNQSHLPVPMGSPRNPEQHNFLADLVQSPESEQSSINVSEAAYSPSVDPDIARVEHIIDVWSGDLKRNLLAELSKAKIKVIEQGKLQLQKERSRHSAEENRLQNEIEGLKELLHTYEQSIERKDQVISNLTRGLQQQREKLDMTKAFSDWKTKHIDHERQEFSSRLALKHYRKQLIQKVWDSWHSIIEAKWKSRVEKACQAKAQEVCISLTNDYEARVSSLEDALTAAREEVNRLHREREAYEETMKKAFMRGVCALNLEAMNMFHEGEDHGGRLSPTPRSGDHEDSHQVIPVEPVYSVDTAHPPAPRIVTSISVGSKQTSTLSDSTATSYKTKSVSGAGKPRVLTAKVTASSDAPRSSQLSKGVSVPMGLNPPMSSVLVERHHPVTKQTIGHATASRYQRQPELFPGRKTSGKLTGTTPTVRIVQ